METPGFGVVDYVVFAFSIVISLGIGVYFGICRQQKQTPEEYLIGGRKMKIFPVAMSFVVTFESSIFMMGTPAEVYFYGFQWVLMSFGWWIAISISAFLYAPLLHSLNITSSFEYLELRYKSKLVRGIACFSQILYYLLYMGSVLFGPAIALKGMFGFPIYASVLLTAFVAMSYTALGGMKSVVWTDVFQCTVMILGVIAVIIKGSIEIGGLGKVFRISSEQGRMDFNFSWDPTYRITFWIAFLGNTFRVSGILFNQASLQRISSLPTSKAAITSLMIAAPWFVIFSTLACIEGLVAFAYYYDVRKCDPIESGQITDENQLIVILVLDLFKNIPGLAGLFISSIFSASLSTLSSGLGSVSANAWEDIIKPLIGTVSDLKATLIAKSAVVVAGLVSIGISFLFAEIGGTLQMMSSLMLGIAAAPLSGMYLLGILFPCANTKGAIIGAVISVAFVSWTSIGAAFSIPKSPTLPSAPISGCYNDNISTTVTGMSTPFTESTTTEFNSDELGIKALYTLSPYLLGAIGIATCIIIGLLFSIILGRNEEPVERTYIAPIVHRIWQKSKFLKKRDRDKIDKVFDDVKEWNEIKEIPHTHL